MSRDGESPREGFVTPRRYAADVGGRLGPSLPAAGAIDRAASATPRWSGPPRRRPLRPAVAAAGITAVAAAVLLPPVLLSRHGAAPDGAAPGPLPEILAPHAATPRAPPPPPAAPRPLATDSTALAALLPASITGEDGRRRYELVSVGPFDRLAAAGADDTVVAEYHSAEPRIAGRVIAASFSDAAAAQAFRQVLVETLVTGQHYAVLNERDAPEIHGRFVGLSGPDGRSGLVWNNEQVVALATGEPQTSQDLFNALPF